MCGSVVFIVSTVQLLEQDLNGRQIGLTCSVAMSLERFIVQRFPIVYCPFKT